MRPGRKVPELKEAVRLGEMKAFSNYGMILEAGDRGRRGIRFWW